MHYTFTSNESIIQLLIALGNMTSILFLTQHVLLEFLGLYRCIIDAAAMENMDTPADSDKKKYWCRQSQMRLTIWQILELFASRLPLERRY